MDSGANLVRTRAWGTRPGPGSEEVLLNGGLYRDSRLDGTLRGAELGNRGSDCARGERGRGPPWGRAVRVLAPLGLAESCTPSALGVAFIPAAWEQ